MSADGSGGASATAPPAPGPPAAGPPAAAPPASATPGGGTGSGAARKGGAPPARAEPPSDPIRGYGNIYTPHAGSMIIQVQRESGLQSRTIVLTGRQVRVLRFIMSRTGKIIAASAAAIAILLIVEAARVPTLTYRISRMEHTAQRLDTLERSLSELQKRYDQVRTMMGSDAPADASRGTAAAVGFAPAPTGPTRAPANARASGAAGTDATLDVSRASRRAGAPDAASNAASNAASDGATDAATGAATTGATGATGATGGAPSGDTPSDSTATTTPHPTRARRARAPEAVVPVVPPPPDSGSPPSPEAEPQ